MEGVGVGEDSLLDAFTSRRFFVLINAIFSWVVISKVFFLGEDIRMADMGFMAKSCSVG